MNGVCRLCAEERADEINFNINSKLANKIKQIAHIQISENDDLPQTVCVECIAEIYRIERFLEKCKTAQNILRVKLIEFEDEEYLEEDPIVPEEINKREQAVTPDCELHGSCDEIERPKSDLNDEINVKTKPLHTSSRKENEETTKKRKKTKKVREPFNSLKCSICPAVICGPKDYQDHYLKEHKSKPIYTCEVCLKQFSYYRSLTRHVILHSEGPQFACDICDQRFAQKVQLRNHLATHSSDSQYKCEVCGNEYRHYASLYKHFRLHKGTCKICLKKFRSKNSLKNHKCRKL